MEHTQSDILDLTKQVIDKASQNEAYVKELETKFQKEYAAQQKMLQDLKGEADEINKKYGDLSEVARKQGEYINQLQTKQVSVDEPSNEYYETLVKALGSDAFKQLKDRSRDNFTVQMPHYAKQAGVPALLRAKTGDYSGSLRNNFLSTDTQTTYGMYPSIKDVMRRTFEPYEKYSTQVFTMTTDQLTGGLSFISENADATEISATMTDATFDLSRAAFKMKVPRNMFLNPRITEVANSIIRNSRRVLDNVESIMIVGGNGSGSNPNGLYKGLRSLTFDNRTYSAGDMTATSTWSTGYRKITFGAAHGLQNGDKITLAATTEINGTYRIFRLDEFSIVIKASTAATTNAVTLWTGTGISAFRDSVVAPANNFDAIVDAAAFLTKDGFSSMGGINSPTAVLMGVADWSDILKAKSSIGEYQGLTVDAYRNYRINGLLVGVSQWIPDGSAAVGDFENGVYLNEPEGEVLQFIGTDTTNVQANTITVIGQKQLHIVYANSYAAAWVDLAGTKSIIEI